MIFICWYLTHVCTHSKFHFIVYWLYTLGDLSDHCIIYLYFNDLLSLIFTFSFIFYYSSFDSLFCAVDSYSLFPFVHKSSFTFPHFSPLVSTLFPFGIFQWMSMYHIPIIFNCKFKHVYL